jgi:integrative and conjugative element protein (TIGR02256 family)
MLIGYRGGPDVLDAVVVTGAIAAGPGAQRARHRFVPDGAWQYEQLEGEYEASGRTSVYVGDWHSHPRGATKPSHTDITTYARVARDPQASVPHPVILILSLRRKSVSAWTIDNGKVGPMTIVVDPKR